MSLGRSTSALLTFLTALIATGGRVLIICLMALVYQFPNFKHSDEDHDFITRVTDELLIRVSFGAFGEPATWRMLLPVSTAVAIQIIFVLIQFCFDLCRNSIDLNCLYEKQVLDSEYIELKRIHIKSLQCSNDSTFTKITEISTHEKTKCQTLLYQAFAGIRSLIFRVIIDCHSFVGLLSSACYATWAVWIKLHIIVRHFPHGRPTYYNIAGTTALTYAMLSYTINVILVLTKDHHRKKGLVVSVLFAIYPVYVYIMAAGKNIHVWYDLNFKGTNSPDSTFDEVIVLLIPIVTVTCLVILVNITAVVLGIVTDRNTAKMKKYFIQKITNYNVNNETNRKNHTI